MKARLPVKALSSAKDQAVKGIAFSFPAPGSPFNVICRQYREGTMKTSSLGFRRVTSRLQAARSNRPLTYVSDSESEPSETEMEVDEQLHSFPTVAAPAVAVSTDKPRAPKTAFSHKLSSSSSPSSLSAVITSKHAAIPRTSEHLKHGGGAGSSSPYQGVGGYPGSSVRRQKQCACCGATSTPLWRDIGKELPLCNACGIRWKKYGIVCDCCQYVPCKQERESRMCKRCGSSLSPANKRARVPSVTTTPTPSTAITPVSV